MAVSLKATSVLLSIVIAAGLVLGAFVLSSPEGAPLAGAESSEELLKAYAAKDSDSDGLFDWQEVLYGADPSNAHSFDAALSDREAVDAGKVAPKFSSESSEVVLSSETLLNALPGSDPATGSLTERFAKEFFGNYLTQKASGNLPTEEDLLAFFDQETARALSNESAVAYTVANVTVTQATGPAALQAYGRATEAAQPPKTASSGKSELAYLQEYFASGDTGALSQVRTIAAGYDFAAKKYIGIPVPPEAAAGHLMLANALSHMHKAITMMGKIDADPLQGMQGLEEYRVATDALEQAFAELGRVFAAAKVRLGVPYDLLP